MVKNQGFPQKTCLRCGRSFNWRKKWARDWPSVRYCSQSCRRKKISHSDLEREQQILQTLRAAGKKGIKLHNLARGSKEVEHLRQAARRLAIDGQIIIVQNGRPVDPREIRGPVDIMPLTRN